MNCPTSIEWDLECLSDVERNVFELLKEYATTVIYTVLVAAHGSTFVPTNSELESMTKMKIEEFKKVLFSLEEKGFVNLYGVGINDGNGDRFVIIINPIYHFNGNKPSLGLCNSFGISKFSDFYMEHFCNHPDLSKRKKAKPNINNEQHLLEKDIETYLIDNLHLIEDGMVLTKRQHRLASGIIDILVKDKNNKTCIIEIKKVDYDKSLVFQSVYYPSQFTEEIRMITIAPGHTKRIKQSLTSLKYVEILEYYFDDDGKLKIRKSS